MVVHERIDGGLADVADGHAGAALAEQARHLSADGADADGDGVADGCDPCPADALDDGDGDGVCDTDDVCDGFDDAIDSDGDGVADGCDGCPADRFDDRDGDG
ncbi:MAG: hypothetical protein AAFP86_24895, partial [Planctomycetota bacterium]